MLQLRNGRLVARRSVLQGSCVRARFHTTPLLRTPPTPSQPDRNVLPSALSVPTARHQRPLTGVGSTVGSLKQRLPNALKEYKLERPSLRLLWGSAAGVLLLGVTWCLSGADSSDDALLGRPNRADEDSLSRVPTSKLISGWIVYAFCSSPFLLDISGTLFKLARHIPVVANFADSFARATFFRQFFAGQTVDEAEAEVWAPLRKNNIGIIVSFDTEGEGHDGISSPESIRQRVAGTLSAIERAGKLGTANSTKEETACGVTRCWVSTKISAIVPDPKMIIRASEHVTRLRTGVEYYPGVPEDGDFDRLMNGRGLSVHDKQELRNIYSHLQSFMRAGQKHGVRVIIAAEESWYQPVVDVMTEQLMREFNTGADGKPAVVVASAQAYLRRNADLIKSQLERARAGGYKLMLQQVRGAYMPDEGQRWEKNKMPGPPPVWTTKAETDTSYHQGMEMIINAIAEHRGTISAPDVAAIFATHNEATVNHTLDHLRNTRLGGTDGQGRLVVDEYTASRVAFAQNYGMKDSMTNRIAGGVVTPTGLPMVCKSAPHGPLENALPRLARIAQENKFTADRGSVAERKRLGRELCRRFVPMYGSDR